MKLELVDRDNETPLLRLFAFTLAEVALLRDVCASLASGSALSVKLHTLPFVEPVDSCQLTSVANSWDQGVIERPDTSLQCSLSAGTWGNIAGLVEPFAESESGRSQWLDSTNIPIFLSRDGCW